ncbi:HNH endonuclease signature motif containing protein [Mycetocola zhadangensis]|uniref:HNH endonuclease n=1 Tax=Mycetocola zhadangensis TaxID=1164595 RepID=A0A3L7J6G6_9MICO|nr:HNH endonuclease signature motif containing protein [Mycetocola zhadangensis]RLQ84092.1 HNH endonuclease [Mycetocola zhadangensis]GGE96248.1 hypothetical protein GCM10011313_19030 [Mycetocola zhadangensis]
MSQILDRLPEVVAQLRVGLGLPAQILTDSHVGPAGSDTPGVSMSNAGRADPGTSDPGVSKPGITDLNAHDLVDRLDADEVEWFTRTAAEVMKLGEALVAIGAGRIAVLSDRELGYSGLAQRRGVRTAEHLVQSLTGSSYRDAARQVRIGGAMGEAKAVERAQAQASSRQVEADGEEPDVSLTVKVPWHFPISLAASKGTLSTSAAEAITRGLGDPTEDAPADLLQAAAERLLPLANTTDMDELGRLAREERNLIDVTGVAQREGALREMRGLRMLRRDATGMRGVALRLDPENEAIFSTLIDAATGPRRGGPRFVDAKNIAAAEALIADPRSTEQIALDTMIQLMELGAEADPGVLFPRQSAVRIVVTADSLDTRSEAGGLTGTGMLEDSREAVSGATLERTICSAELTAILLSPDNVPFESSIGKRLFDRRQRRALAVRDGGCMFPNCDRPVSWTEAHHIIPWSMSPKTEVIDGILLCRHHHMLLHNTGWVIRRRETDYVLVPPVGVDPDQKEIPLESKSGLMRARKRARPAARAPTGPPARSEPVGKPLDTIDSS